MYTLRLAACKINEDFEAYVRYEVEKELLDENGMIKGIPAEERERLDAILAQQDQAKRDENARLKKLDQERLRVENLNIVNFNFKIISV